MKVFTPGDNWEVRETTSVLSRRNGPSFLRLDKSTAGETQKPNEVFEIGKARMLRQGEDFTLVTAGGILEEALCAADELAKQGITCRVLQYPCLKPFDSESIAAAARETKGIISI